MPYGNCNGNHNRMRRRQRPDKFPLIRPQKKAADWNSSPTNKQASSAWGHTLSHP